MPDNRQKIYNKLVESGYKGTYEQFDEYLNGGEENVGKVYNKLASAGYKGTIEQFSEYAGIAPKRVTVEDVHGDNPAQPTIVTLDPKNTSFEDWYNTVPADRNDTTNYNLRRAYELLPSEQLEKWRTASSEQLNDEAYHLPSVAYNEETDEYEFLKSKNHPTVGMELADYEKNDKFRKQYRLDASGDYYKYVRRDIDLEDMSFDNYKRNESRLQEINAAIDTRVEEIIREARVNEVSAERSIMNDARLKDLQYEQSMLKDYISRSLVSDEYAQSVAQIHSLTDQFRADSGIGRGDYMNRSRKALYHMTNTDFGMKMIGLMSYAQNSTLAAADFVIYGIEQQTARSEKRIADYKAGKDGWLNDYGRGFVTTNWNALDATQTLNLATQAFAIAQKFNDDGTLKDGETLTDDQQTLLKALVLARAADSSLVDMMWERIGANTMEQVKYTLEFILTSELMGASAISGKMAKAATKKITNVAAKKLTYKVVDYAVQPTLQTVFNPVNLTQNTLERMTGNVVIDENGNFAGFQGDEDMWPAMRDAFVSAYIENFSEKIGEDIFKPLTYGNKALRNMDNSVGRLYNQMATRLDVAFENSGVSNISGAFKIAKDLRLATGVQGIPGEYVEEIVGGLMNAAFVGDQSFHKYDENGNPNPNYLWNSEQQLETLLSCSVMSIGMTTFSNVRNGVTTAADRRAAKSYLDQAAKAMQNQDIDFKAIDDAFENGTLNDIAKVVFEIGSAEDMTDDKRQILATYVGAKINYAAMRDADMSSIEDSFQQIEDEARASVNAETKGIGGGGGRIIQANVEVNGETFEGVPIVSGRVLTRIETDANGNDYMVLDTKGSSSVLYIRVPGEEKPRPVYASQIKDIVATTPLDQFIEMQKNELTGSIINTFGAQYEDGLPLEQLIAECAVLTNKEVQTGNVSQSLEKGRKYHIVNPANGELTEAEYVEDSESGHVFSINGNNVEMDDSELKESMLRYRIALAEQAGVQDEVAQTELEMLTREREADMATRPVSDEQLVETVIATQVSKDESGNYTPDSSPRAVAVDILMQFNYDAEKARLAIENTINGLAANTGMQQEAAPSIDQNIANEASNNTEYTAALIEMYNNALVELDLYAQNFVGEPEIGETYPLTNETGTVYGRFEGYDADGNVTYRETDESGENDGRLVVLSKNEFQKQRRAHNIELQNQKPITISEAQEIAEETPVMPTETIAENTAETQIEPMPTIEVKGKKKGETKTEIDWYAVAPERGHSYIYQESQLPTEIANELVNNGISEGEKELKKLQTTKAPKLSGTDLIGYQKAVEQHNNDIQVAQSHIDYWKAIKSIQDKIVAQKLAERIKADEERHAQAVLEEQAAQAEEAQNAETRTETGANNVAANIREKWNVAKKIEGAPNEMVLANGEKIAGRFMLVESGAATPSHDATNGFVKSEGFPLDENEQSVNDRDYERDTNAQQITRQIAAHYDSRALQTPVVVSNDGVVLSGNGRTMAGELAALNNTDGEYIDYLNKYSQQYGFTKEQVESMQHPRVVFVPNESIPYTAENFAKFNQQEMKGQSKTEQAVKLGKVVDDATFNKIIRKINNFDTLGDFYADTKASTEAIGNLLSAGVINNMQRTEMFDGDTISSAGREMLENMLIGKAFESNPDAVRQLTAYKSMRQSIITALAEISNNIALGEEYSLGDELSAAIELVYNARQSGYKVGDKVSAFARQGDLFSEGGSDDECINAIVLMLADCLNDNKVKQLKNILTIFNRNAAESASGQFDIFSEKIKSKDDILQEVLVFLQNGTDKEKQQAINNAIEQRKAEAVESVQENGAPDSIDTGSGEVDANVSSAEQEVDTNPTDAQKEAGNYKKGHVTIDGFDISIENPRGSARSGVDENGKEWSVTMHDTYGYIRNTESVDGDHIDIFLSDHIGNWNGSVFVVDQVKPDGSFDEHKVMYGFDTEEEAREAYLANYSEGWQGLGNITEVSKRGFKKWIESSHRKTKPFREYRDIILNNKTVDENPSGNKLVTDAQYEELKKRMRDKLRGQANVGIDPEILSIGVQMAVYHIEKGTRKFADYAKAMIADLGNVIRPYLKAFYNGARELPEVEEAGYAEEMTPYDEVKKFDVANFDKETENLGETISVVEQENKIEQEVEKINDENKQTEASTEAVASEAAAIASQAESDVENITTEQQGNEIIETIDNAIEKVNEQLALLGYYEADTDDESQFHESYGYMKTAEKKAVKDMERLARQIAKDLGIEVGRKQIAKANIAPAGGDVSFRLPLTGNKTLHLWVRVAPDGYDNVQGYHSNLKIEDMAGIGGGVLRIENPDDTVNKYGHNHNFSGSITYDDLLDDIKNEIRMYDREFFNQMEERVAAIKSKESENKSKKTSKQPKKDLSLQISLFGEQNDNELKEENNGLQGNDELRSAGMPAESVRHEQGSKPEQKTTGETAEQETAGVDTGRGRESSESDRSLQSGLRELKNQNNNHAERGTDYAPKSVDARIEANIKAIELMQQLIDNGEQATPEQMAILRQFSGWGGLGKAFTETTGWGENPQNKRLKELLGTEAYEQANMSRNSAYYTPANVIDTLWDIAKALGFKGGNILEGSAGIGNIIGLMPTDISNASDIHAVEIDQTAGNILSLLYPDAQVDVQGFETVQIENGSIDLAITNVPFVTGLRVNDTTGDKDLSKKFHDIHDFCIAKNIRKLREGGIGIFITSNGTLDNSARLREWIVGEGNADVVGAFRLNNNTFGGTGATSDIVVVRKRINGKKSVNAINVNDISGERVAEFNTGKTKTVNRQQVPIIKPLSMDYNAYFINHPEMMGGKMYFGFEKGETYRETSKALYPENGINQNERLDNFVKDIESKDWSQEALTFGDFKQAINARFGEELGENVKEGSMLVDKKGVLCIAQRGRAVPLDVNANKVKGHTKVECFKSYQGIKQALADVLDYQTQNDSDEGLQPLLDKLNRMFDNFVKTYGHLHKNTSITFLKNDVDFSNIVALETYKETGDINGNKIQTYGKTDVFTRRVVEKDKAPEPKNIKDGIIASIYLHGRVDIPYISKQLNMSEDDVKSDILNSGLGFENPSSKEIEVSYEYLSGNVREKLEQAIANNTDGRYNKNIEELEKIIPMTIPSHLIDFSLGSSWINPTLYEEYVKDRTDISVEFTAAGGSWYMKAPYFVNEEKNRTSGVLSKMLNKLIYGTQLIEAAMQNRTITVSETRKKWDGSTETTVDKEATQACANKIDEIRQDFKDWAKAKMQSDSEMSQRIERIYNDMFNNYVPKEIPDDFIPEYFGGATHNIKLRTHQAKAVIRGTTQPLLLAHEVGTGKTFTLISIAMEMRRLGTAQKPMIVVQNSTVGQFVESAKQLYPNAKVLTIEDKDHTGEGRKNFYAKIKYNDWDMIVVPQSVFERIPDSEERQMAFIQDKIEEKMLVLQQMQDADQDGNSMIVRQAEREIDQLEEQKAGIAASIQEKRKKRDEKKDAITIQNTAVKALEMLDRAVDDVDNFDDMGIDAVLVDEAHEYKHLGFATAMQRGVKGVDPSYSKKAQGVFLKTQAVLEKNNGRNVIFATGTPISNTAAEIWTFMRYLMPADTMKSYGIYYFDDFVRNFGNLQQMLEFTTSGKFRENNRFAGYVNIPELVRIWSSVADTVLTKDAGGVNDKIPETEGGKAQDIYLPQTKSLRSVMKYVKAKLDEYEKMTGKEKKANSHIPLVMYGIAKAAAVDARLVIEDAVDEPNSKTNEAVRQVLRSLDETKEYKGTVALFADNYQNKQSGFNLYEDIKAKLIDAGVPENQIVIMKSGMSIKKKLEIFDKVNNGEVRVIMGSTFTLGTGVNIQERLHTLIHIDAPNRPMDYTQRNGRILRQGNLHKQMGKPVRVLRFGVEDSLDVTAYQRLKTKGAIADSIMNGKAMMINNMENRVLEEEEDVFGDTVAQLSGSEYAMLKNQAEKDVRKYEAKYKQWQADQIYVRNELPNVKTRIEYTKKALADAKKYLDIVKKAYDGNLDITIGKLKFNSIDSMKDFITEYNKSIMAAENEVKNANGGEQNRSLTININGIDFVVNTTIKYEMLQKGTTLSYVSRRIMKYSCAQLGLEDIPVKQSLVRNAIDDIVYNIMTGREFEEDIQSAQVRLARYEKSLEQLKQRDGKEFEYTAELETSRKRLEEYTAKMKEEMEEKEKKYADMDAEVAAATGIAEAEEATEEDADVDMSFVEGDVQENETNTETEQSKQLAFNAVREALAKAGIEVIEATDEEVQAQKEKVLNNTNGTLMGWVDNEGKIHLSKSGMNTETAVHEYTHLWVEGMRTNNLELWEQIRDMLIKGNPMYDEIKKSAAYSKIKNNDDKIAEEILARISGKQNAKRMEDAARQLMDENPGTEGAVEAASLLGRLRDALHRFWTWCGRTLFGKTGNITTEQVTEMVLADLVNGVNPDNTPGKVSGIRASVEGEKVESEVIDMNTTLVSDILDEKLGVRKDNGKRHTIKRRMIEFERKWFDSLTPLKKMQDVIAEQTGKPLSDYEDAYNAELRRSSITMPKIEKYTDDYLIPMIEASGDILKYAKDNNIDFTQKDWDLFLIALHGLERNEYYKKLNEWDETRDMSGLTALARELGREEDNFTEVAEDYVEQVKSMIPKAMLDNALNSIKASTNAILDIYLESGLISRQQYKDYKSRYEHYVPLRGWSEVTSDEFYDYSVLDPHFQSAIKHTKGRTSLAFDVLANVMNMMESAVVLGEKNKVLQRLFNLAQNRKTDVLKTQSSWYVKDTDGAWIEVLPEIQEGMSAVQAAEVIKAFNEEMKRREEMGEAKRKINFANVGVKIKPFNQHEHYVPVFVNGQKHAIIINGDPSIVKALTDKNELQNNKFVSFVRTTTRLKSQLNTTFNPEFVLRNVIRDAGMAMISSYIEGGLGYANNVRKNINLFGRRYLGQLIRNGKCDSDTYTQYWNEFIENGGETGFTRTLNAEQQAKKLSKLYQRMLDGKSITDEGNIATIMGAIDSINRWGEDLSRFAVFVTNREMGRSVEQSVNMAKNATINFQRKGGGTFAAYLRTSRSFFNATMQALYRFGSLAKNNPKRFGIACTAIAISGAIVPLLNIMMLSLMGDDDDWKAYRFMTDYTGNHNWHMFVGNGFITIPYPQEFAALFAAGNIAFRHLIGWSDGTIAEDMGGMIMEQIPFDFAGKGRIDHKLIAGVTPQIMQEFWDVYYNEDFMGRPIYKKTPFNENDPAWTKAYKSTSGTLVDFAKYLNGNDPISKHSETWDWLNNPAAWQYVATNEAGGVGRILNNVSRLIENGYTSDNMPFLRNLYMTSDMSKFAPNVNSQYYNLMTQFNELTSSVNGYEKSGETMYEQLDRYIKLKTSPEYMANDITKDLQKTIKEMQDNLKLMQSYDASDEQIDMMRDNITNLQIMVLDITNNMIIDEGRPLTKQFRDYVDGLKNNKED